MPEPATPIDGYRAFISYSHRDKDWGEWLHRKLETYRVPKKIVGKETPYGPVPRRLTPIFRDRDELATADDLSEEINAALKASQFLLAICSPAAAQSKWVNEEIKTFKRLHGEGRVRAVIVGGEPFSGDPKTECFPEALRFKSDADGNITNEHAEPIAADLRPGGDGKKYAISKLVAGLTGATLDELLQREQVRRNQRMRAVAAGFGTVAVAMGALAWDAMRQRDVARVAEADAVEARGEAEAQIEFMLTDLRKRLDAVGRLDILESVGERALGYYEKRDLSKASPDELGRRARAQLLVGEVDNQRGDLDAALDAYTAAAKTTEEQLRRDPDNPDRIFDHSQSVFWVGYIAWQRGDADAARTYFTQYHDQAKRLVEIDPENDDYQMELKYSLTNLGTLEIDEGNISAAEYFFRASLKTAISLHKNQPDDIDRILALGQAHAWLADAVHRQLKLREAKTTRLAELAVYEQGQKAFPNDATLIQAVAVSHQSLSQLELALGELNSALEHALKATDHNEQLLASNPESMFQTNRTAFAYHILALAYAHLEQAGLAQKHFKKSIFLAEQLIKSDDNVVEWKATYYLPLIKLAELESRFSRIPKTVDSLGPAITHLSELVSSGERNPEIVKAYCAGLSLEYRLTAKNDHYWQTIANLIAPTFEQHGLEGKTLLAEAYARTGERQKAANITSRLYAAGYRHPDFMALLAEYPDLMPPASGAISPP